jgi:cytochrome b subunit of formate dehydrogenase/nitrate/TMAO reductase-like tetraheme cytochrome c subunit
MSNLPPMLYRSMNDPETDWLTEASAPKYPFQANLHASDRATLSQLDPTMKTRFLRLHRLQSLFFLCSVLSLLFLMPLRVTSAAVKNSECLTCHAMEGFQSPDSKNLFVNAKLFEKSVHSFLSCTDCHSDVSKTPHPPQLAKVNCGSCHEEQQKKFERSIHAGKVIHNPSDTGNGKKTFICADCHSPHTILPRSDPASATHHTNVPALCGTCHQNLKFVIESPMAETSKPFFAYRESIHGRSVAAGSERAAVCSDCHNAHDILPPNNPKSTIFKTNTPETCKKCHENIYAEYTDSVHGKAVKRGLFSAPVCVDCHGIHSIKSHIDPSSNVAAQVISRSTCGQCHSGEKLSAEFGVPENRVTSYFASYHGLESRVGSVETANCASCHGVHHILPSNDPRSTVNKANLAQTCGQCHPGASENFAKGRIHLLKGAMDAFGGRIITAVTQFYVWLIFLVVGGMILHNAIDYFARARLRLREDLLHGKATIERIHRSGRIQHGVMLSSFFLLVITGFALKFPDAQWVHFIFLGNAAVRGVIHRIAAVVFIGLACFHFYFILFTKLGRQELKAWMPRLQDVRDLPQMISYNLGLTNEHPRFDRFSYVEKMEYWALVWGTLIMVATGLALWAKTSVLHYIPKWGLDVFEVIHYYEAWLATLAIIVWHLYMVLMRPGSYSSSWMWLTGKITQEEMIEEHPLEWERMEREARGAGKPEEEGGQRVPHAARSR